MYHAENSQTPNWDGRSKKLPLKLWRGVGSGVFLLGLTSFFTDISAEMLTSILPLYAVGFLQLSLYQFGFIDGLYQGASVVVRLVSGVFSDRTQKPKEVATVGYGLSAISKLGLLIGTGGWGFLSSVIFADRVGKGIRTPSRDALIAEQTAPEKLATAFGVHRAMDTAGATVGPILAAGILFLLPGDYHSVFAVSLVFAVIGVAVIGLFVRNKKSITSVPLVVPRITFKSLGLLFTDRRLGGLLILSSLLAVVTLSDSFLYLTASKVFNMPPTLFPLLFVGGALVFMICAVPVGMVADRIGRQKVFIAGHIFLALGYVLLLTSHASMALLLVLLLCIGLFYAMTDGVLASVASSLLPEHLRATGLALVATAVGVAKIASSILYGILWSVSGQVWATSIFLIALVAVVGIALVTFYFLRKRPLSYVKN